MPKFPRQTLLAVATFAAILLGIHYGLGHARGLDPASLRPVLDFPRGRSSFIPVVPVAPPALPSALAVPNPAAHGITSAAAANPTLESAFLNEDDGALDHFYAALQQLNTGDHTVRIVHYGDSPTTADLITGDAREILQQRFGNAGPGFVLIAKPWAWYGHHGIDVTGSGWQIDTAVGSMREAAYGLGGAIFTGPVGASSKIRLLNHDSTSVEVQYLQQPNGGDLDVIADDVQIASVKTSGDTRENGASTVVLPLNTHVVTLRVSGNPVKVFGVVFGRAGKGITYDSIGLNGASTTVMSRAFKPDNWFAALQHRNPDLVIINYGTNESSFPAYVDKLYEPELRRAIARVRTALPQASILIMSPMDRGAHTDGDAIETMPAIPKIVEIQQRVARELGCGFFNTYQAMGGHNTMARWYNDQPRMVAADLIHPSPQGARIVAGLLTGQLLIGYERYLQNHRSLQPSSSPAIAATTSNSTDRSRPASRGVQ
jgi:lysophospholipase L1-like esterase